MPDVQHMHELAVDPKQDSVDSPASADAQLAYFNAYLGGFLSDCAPQRVALVGVYGADQSGEPL